MSHLMLARRARTLLAAAVGLSLMAGVPAHAGEKKPQRLGPPFAAATDGSWCTEPEPLASCRQSTGFDVVSGAVQYSVGASSTGRPLVLPGGGSYVDFAATDRLRRAAVGYTYRVTLRVNLADSTARMDAPCTSPPTTYACSARGFTGLGLTLDHSACPLCRSQGTRLITDAQVRTGPPGPNQSAYQVEGQDVVFQVTMLNPEGGLVPEGDVSVWVKPLAAAALYAYDGSLTGSATALLDAVVVSVTRESL